MRFLRDLGRRKLRTGLTITGISIGIMALVVFGSMANKLNMLVQGGSDYYRGKAVVTQSNAFTTGNFEPLSVATADKIAKVEGVDVATNGVEMMLEDDLSGVSMGVPPMISGYIPGSDKGRETFTMDAAKGRELTAADEGTWVTVLGSDLAKQKAKTVGDSITIRKHDFKVVGILAPTLTAPDNEAIVPLSAAQQLFVESLPPLVREKLNPSEVLTSITVYPKQGVSAETVKANITAAMPDVSVMTGQDFDKLMGSSMSILNTVLFGIGMLSLLVGGLSTINTMAMAVAERTREIGIKRAIGASRWRIRREVVLESASIGLIAGLIGLGIGAGMTYLFNEAGRESGNMLFLLTPGTALTAVGFATVLGALAGFLPAWHASRLDPVAALRYE